MRACTEGLLSWPTTAVVWRGSAPVMAVRWLVQRKASMTTLPLTDWIGSMTTLTLRALSFSKEAAVFTSVPESQQPKPGCEWYQPTANSPRPVCLSISSIAVWYASSTASTLTPEADCGMAKQSSTRTV